MKLPGTRLSGRDRDNLMEQLAQFTNQGPRSSEVIQRVVSDRSGTKHDLGGQSHGVFVNEFGIPATISEDHAKFLDCGHTVTSFEDVLGKCSYGHILCKRHQLYKCHKCGKIICDIEAVFDEEGEASCPDHGGFPWGGLFGFLVLMGVILYALGRMN